MSPISLIRDFFRRNGSFLVFVLKAICGALLIILTSQHFGYGEYFWCLISFLLVLTPDSQGAVLLAVSRLKANMCGAVGAMLAIPFELPYVYSICIALAATALLCRLVNAFDSARVALAGSVIVLTHAPGVHIWDNSLQRILAVALGCLLGLLMTLLFHRKLPDKESLVDLTPLPREQRERIVKEIAKQLGRLR